MMTWITHPKQKRGGLYERYKNRLVVIVSERYIRLSERVYDELGQPLYVTFVTQPGSNRWGICATTSQNPDGYKASIDKGATPLFSCVSFIRASGLTPPAKQRRAYEGHMEGAFFVVDTDKYSVI